MKRAAFTAGLVLLVAAGCFAQNEKSKPAEGSKAFQLDFVVKELEDGKVVNSRNYSIMVATPGNAGSIRAGDKVPVITEGGGSPKTTYLDVGVNIDCRGVQETDGKLTLTVTAEISTAASNANPPLIRTTRWNSNVVVPLRKPTALFSSDDTSSKRRMTLELTASPIN